MSENMKLWNQVCETDPEITKHVNQRGGFTAIDAQSQIKRATELWGPQGVRWGLRDLVYQDCASGGAPVVLMMFAKFYYPDFINAEEYSEGVIEIATDIAFRPGDEMCMKLRTKAITKALSQLGFNSDVFEGQFDDNEYVAAMRAKFKPQAPPPISEAVPEPSSESVAVIAKVADQIKDMADIGHVLDFRSLINWVFTSFGRFPKNDMSVGPIVDKLRKERPNVFTRAGQ